MYNPIATYRLQFHKEFTLEEFSNIIPYLQKLGVSTIYASPVFAATPGSTHGYDGINPHQINPEIGTEEQLKELSIKLKNENIGWLQDIVPNHMAFHSDNAWLMDVLEKGMQSVYATFFDITWTGLLYKGKLMVPFLGSTLDEVIANKELTIGYKNGRFVFYYYDNTYPLSPRSYPIVLQAASDKPNQAIQQLLQQMPQIKSIEDPKTYSKAWDEFLLQLTSLMKNTATKYYIDKCLEAVNNNTAKLTELANEQIYRLSHWQETDRQINYRRFFTVNGLICLNIQEPEVFQHFHQYIKSLMDEGVFQGLRIDHIDGLYDPSAYLRDLRGLSGDETYVVVEKILQPNEGIPKYWPVQGTTGYDFLSIVNNLFTLKNNAEVFTQFYEDLIRDQRSVHQQIHEKKSYILHEHMGGELENLYRLFMELSLVDKKAFASVHREDLKNAIGEFLVQCPVYRYYGNSLPLQGQEAASVQGILNNIRRNNASLSHAISLLEEAILKNPHRDDGERNKRALRFYQRCMQFTGPLMAKGVEDTVMYTYNRFIGHNEVGDAPEAFGFTPEEFHQKMEERQERWPLSINATSTHDTKRGEDVRARLNVLSEIDGEWTQAVQEWMEMNKDLKKNGAPDVNDEYFIYQSLIGAYPMPGEQEENFAERFQEYLQKALREAKTNSNWTTPDTEYEKQVKKFAVGLLDQSRPFWKSFQQLHQKVTDFGIVTSLAQVLLKFTCPGIPDVYQGCELWDFSFVDPDNRRPVDYSQRQQWLQELETGEAENLSEHLWENRFNARVKLWLVHQLFVFRRQHAEFFLQAQYLPLQVEGKYKNHVLAFARKYKQNLILVAVPLYTAALCGQQEKTILELDWQDTRIILPQEAAGELEDLLLHKKSKREKNIPVKDLFKQLPFALLKTGINENTRSAGVLMHITSLPSPFAIGDMGREAKAFADFLHRSYQTIWQLLPLNPTEQGQGHSPYSSTSSRAGNPLLISPELLVKDGLIEAQHLYQYQKGVEMKVDYTTAENIKQEIFENAWQSFVSGKGAKLQQGFTDFCQKEREWLNDFALYMVLKSQQGGKAWFQWPDEFKLREKQALEKLAEEEKAAIEKIKFIQFLFLRQWKSLKEYCNKKGIRLLGDLPFYISYDSVDVWSNREIFALDDEGNMTGVAGTPPDAFSAEGQLWGMPVFKWDVLKEKKYSWWIERLRKNIELFDLVRLDHFRAFADYWEVSANDTTAKNGAWKPGPSSDFFTAIEKEFGELPFVAEDLGEINDAVFQLRDDFRLPGMKVLAFAFDDSMPSSDYIPHNYAPNFVVYTGTHDNNTIRGWYRKDADEATRQRLQQYAGKHVTEEEIHLVLGRMAYASIAKTAILPLQDILGLDETARMNTPSSAENNWTWRLTPGQLNGDAEHRLKEWVWLYNRK